ncbi:acyl carrier protein [Salmonella enterica]|nr:acyl carrier protein [Salmonella enterica]EKT7777413.1 acyl carrier protein [Salmonella enterica]
MNDPIATLEWLVQAQQDIPSLEEMPRRTLAEKGIAGPTAAHVIEEIHTPLNLALVTFTTGSSAFQNIVGVTHSELPLRVAAGKRALAGSGVIAGQQLLITYAPLVNVFTRQALDESDLRWSFLSRSCRDALLIALCRQQPDVVVGESSFLRATLEQALKMDLAAHLPKKLTLITAGTPLDETLVPLAASLDYTLHDLYGCQEFGWLALDGVPLRDDISLVPTPQGGEWREVIVGGLPTGDRFPVAAGGHLCNPQGAIQTWKRRRATPEYDMVVMATTAQHREIVERTARTILRIKGRVCRVAPQLQTAAAVTHIRLSPVTLPGEALPCAPVDIIGPQGTAQFDALLQAQRELQQHAKNDPAWSKLR